MTIIVTKKMMVEVFIFPVVSVRMRMNSEEKARKKIDALEM